jgi:GNAT superfamily N-acetyltransferase
VTAAVALTRALTGPQRARFTHVFEASFPPEEREPADELLDSVARGERRCYLASLGGDVVGLAVVLGLESGEADVLEYLAVDPERRSGGIGRVLLDRVRADLGQPTPARLGLVFEVEPVDAAAPADDQRRRRVAFYERGGAAVVACASGYRAPNLAGAGSVPFTLMWLPAGDGVAELRGDLLRRCVSGILVESYGLDARDELVRSALSGLAC